MKVKFLSNISYTTGGYNIDYTYVDIDENILKEIGKTKQYLNGKVVDYVSDFEIKNKIRDLKQKLFDTDYQAIKFAEGELTEEEYAETKAQRREWRKKINELELQLAKLISET